MGAQHERPSLLGLKLTHHSVPQNTSGTKFGDLHKEVHSNRKKERKATSKEIDIEALRQC
ncbi:unannotated protein [freshwater metagenome]|uniref:Unannotated protein n=1 Tax=freshwater metagenome TaxID=449393 RepID=A0A6J6A021_9ZZZZ